jgi:dihydroneopterin aldolase
MRPAPTVVKLGGSHAFSEHLASWIGAIADCAGHVIVVPGGGPFADAVRDAQPKIGFDDDAAHHMALLAMEQYGCALASLNRTFVLADSLATIQHARETAKVPVWMPSHMALAANIPSSWDITSDSLAAWLAGRLSARQLLLVKHVSLGGTAVSLPELIAGGIVDQAFAEFLKIAGIPAALLRPTDHALLGRVIEPGSTVGIRIEP